MDCPYDHDCWVCQKRYKCVAPYGGCWHEDELWCPACRLTTREPDKVVKMLLQRVHDLESVIEQIRSI